MKGKSGIKSEVVIPLLQQWSRLTLLQPEWWKHRGAQALCARHRRGGPWGKAPGAASAGGFPMVWSPRRWPSPLVGQASEWQSPWVVSCEWPHPLRWNPSGVQAQQGQSYGFWKPGGAWEMKPLEQQAQGARPQGASMLGRDLSGRLVRGKASCCKPCGQMPEVMQAEGAKPGRKKPAGVRLLVEFAPFGKPWSCLVPRLKTTTDQQTWTDP
jgi:hypothetical protein